MKKLLLIIITLISNLPAFSQSNAYKPFPEVYGNWWIRTERYYGVGTGNVQTSITDDLYFTTGDTIVNAIKYKKVNYQYKGNAMGPVPPLNYIFNGGNYSFSYRNDSLNRKVYILLGDSLHEIVWYDFNLHIGDTIKNTYSSSSCGVSAPTANLVVVSIDSVLICNNYYKRFGIISSDQNSGSSNACFYLTESIGFTTNFISALCGNNCYFEPSVVPTTYNWSLDDCPDGLGVQVNQPINMNINLYPNPANNIINVANMNANENVLVIITDVWGREIASQLKEKTTDFTLNTSKLPNGIYFVNLKSANINCVQKILVQH